MPSDGIAASRSPTGLIVPSANNPNSLPSSPSSTPHGSDIPVPASPSTRPKDIVGSYLRDLYTGSTATRVLAAQGLGALPSFLPRREAASALRTAVEGGVVGSLADVLAADQELAVQEACLSALASLLLATAAHEEHAAPLRPPHLRLLGRCLMRPEVLTQIGYVLTASSSSRVVLAAARLVAITAPYITQANDVYVLDSRIVPALLAVIASVRGSGGGGARTSSSGGAAATPSSVTLRDAASCALALLALAEATPDLFLAVRTADFFQALAVLYQRCIDPDQPPCPLLPADVAALLLRAIHLAPHPRWLVAAGGSSGGCAGTGGSGVLPKGYWRLAERQLEDSDAVECLVSYVAVEAANLRQLGEGLAETLADNARAVVHKNSLEVDHLQSRMRGLQQRLVEAKDAAAEAQRALEAAEADAEEAQYAAEAADAEVRAGGGGIGGSQEQRRVRREAAEAAVAAEEAAEERRRAVEVADVAEAALRREVATIRRAAGPLRWQSERMARMEAAARDWQEQHGARGRRRVRVTRPSLPTLQQVLSLLSARVKPAPAPEHQQQRPGSARPAAPASPPRPSSPLRPASAASPGASAAASSPSAAIPGPSRQHVEVVAAKLLEGGIVQAVVRLSSVLSSLRALAADVAQLAADLALQPDMAAALGAAEGALGREVRALGAANSRAQLRRKQVESETAKLRRALKLGLPQGSSRRHVELWAGNGLSREVRQEDVEARLQSLEAEAAELECVVADSEALMQLMRGRMQALSAALAAVTDSHTRFTAAYPEHSTPSPSKPPSASAPKPSAPTSHTQLPASNPSPALALSLASQHRIMAKDPSHPAGQLLGMLASALAPLTHGSSNLGALLRQLQGRPPEASVGGAPGAAGAGVAGGGENGRGGGPRKVMSARVRAGGVEAGAAGRISTARPLSAGVRASGPLAMSKRPSAPTAPSQRPSARDSFSMYDMIQATHSPMRGFSAPNNCSHSDLLRRLRALAPCGPCPTWAPTSASADLKAANAAAAAVMVSDRLDLQDDEQQPATAEASLATVGLPVASESRRVVLQAVSSVLFDPIEDEASALSVMASFAGGGGGFGAATAAEAGGCGRGSRPSTARGGGGGGGMTNRGGAGGQLEAEVSAVVAGGGGGKGGSGMCVLDALLFQSELLCRVMDALSGLNAFTRSACRTCRQLPASLSYASLEPGLLGPAMAQLHDMWVDALTHLPDMRVQVAGSVTEIAQLGLVPPADFPAVYQDSGLLDVLVRMLAGQLRPGGGAGSNPGPADPTSPTSSSSPAPRAAIGGGSPSPRASPRPGGTAAAGGGGGGGVMSVSRPTGRMPPPLPAGPRLGPVQQAEQAAAARALLALSDSQPEVLAAISREEKLLSRLCCLCLDHSACWTARLAAADLMGDLVVGGGEGAEAAVAAGAYAALAELLNRDMFPFLNQDPRGSKASVVSALSCLAAHDELLEGVVAAAQAPSGPSSGMPLSEPGQVLGAILRSLWAVCQQAHTTFGTDRNGRGRLLSPDAGSALTATATAAAAELAALADSSPDARRVMAAEMGLGRRLNGAFLQVIKDDPLHEALLELRKNLS